MPELILLFCLLLLVLIIIQNKRLKRLEGDKKDHDKMGGIKDESSK